MKTDIDIAQETQLKPIGDIASALGLSADDLEPYGHTKAKLSDQLLQRLQDKQDGKVVLVTSINPTPAEESQRLQWDSDRH